MTLENQLNMFFYEDSQVRNLDLLITKLVDDCMCELNKREKLKYALNRSLEIGSGIMDNSLRFVGYIPGSKHVGKGVKKSASITGNLMTSIVRKRVGKLLNNVR